MPPKPNPETEAVLGRSGRAGHGTGLLGICSWVEEVAKASGAETNRCWRGIVECSIASSVSITDTTPAAQPVWPISDLLEVTCTGWPPPTVSRRVVNSATSPAGVPVACATTQSRSSTTTPGPAIARRTARLCPSELGA